jgi:2-keto-4-pentenoate hydratase/2-oxohepta-3-ene-1,7-dioic acid hydratase in catechol pathway
MRLCRFNDNRLGLVEGEDVFDVTAALSVLPALHWPVPLGDALITHLDKIIPAVRDAKAGAEKFKLSDLHLLSPVANPSKIPAAPVNYLAHEAEAAADPATFHGQQVAKIQNVGLFLKSCSSLVGASDGVEIAHPERRTDHEIELACIIGKPARNVSRADALTYVAGYAIGLDMTIRGIEERSLRKSLDSFTVLGPYFVTADEIGDPAGLDMLITVNGETRQHANTRDLVIDVPGLIEMASRFYTLLPGDIIMTGTPDGVAPVKPGDEMVCTIDKIGEMRVKVYQA